MDRMRRVKREIGSEFWDVPLSKNINGIFPENTRWFISGTAALETIILNLKGVETVALPSWCCNCMIAPFLRHGINVMFYSVYMEGGTLVCDYSKVNADCWLVVSYFGYTSQVNYGAPSGIIIRDLTHSVFSEIQSDADYYFGSLRKWAGFYTGGYAWSNNWDRNNDCPECDSSYVNLRETAMRQKMDYINGSSTSKSYLLLFEEGEEFLDNCNPMKAYSADVEKAKYFNVGWMKARRRKNAEVLLNGLEKWSMFPVLNDNDCPLFVPILLDRSRRLELRNYLRNHDIYCPIHWPIEKEHFLLEKTKELYERELSIVCDQRYDENDMDHILQIIFNSGVI